jgi:O-antigen/teichoic acid export membrane protein
MSKKDKFSTLINKVALGAGFLFLNSIIIYLIRFFYKLIISRHLGPENYGMFSLGLMFVNVFALLTTLGINNGIVKYIAHYNSLKDKNRVKGTILSSIKIPFIVSTISAILLIIFSDIISNQLFKNPSFKIILIIFSIGIPFFTILKILSKSFIAFKKPQYTIISSTFGKELILLILSILMITLGYSIISLSIIQILSVIIGLTIAFFIFNKKVFPLFSKEITPITQNKELLSFSLPLFFTAIFVDIMGWADTFFLGIYMNPSIVGIYNIALPLATTLGIFLTSFSSMVFPIISEMKAQRNYKEMGKIFSTVSRWIFLISFPIFIIIIFLPKTIIFNFFGKDYISGYNALAILASGYFINVITGPGIQVLKSFSKVKSIFIINSSLALFNVILNIILIPKYSLNGAAIATALSLIIREIIILYMTKKLIKFKYQKIYYLKYFISALIPSSILYYFISNYTHQITLTYLIILSIIFTTTYFIIVIILKGFNKDDIDIVTSLEKRTKINLSIIKKIMR